MKTTTPFDYEEFIVDYPQFANMSKNTVTCAFNYQACVLGQVVSSLFEGDDVKYYWLCIVLAHILTCQQNGTTGRISSASQGSDSVSMDFRTPEWAMYWANTAYGQQVYQCMLEYLAGGHYVSDGNIPYLSDSMSGYGELAFVVI